MDWISVRSCLPNQSEKVLIYDEMCGHSVAMFLAKIKESLVFQSNDDPDIWFHHVVFWMPLPEVGPSDYLNIDLVDI